MEKLMNHDKIIYLLIGLILISFGVFIYEMKNSNEDVHVVKEDTSHTEHNKNETIEEKLVTQINNNYTLSDFYSNKDTELLKETEKIYSELSKEEQIGQMIITAGGTYGKPVEKIKGLIKTKSIGGIVLLKGSGQEFKKLIQEFNDVASSTKNCLPLIFSCDAEPSLINKKISGSPPFPVTSEIKNEKESFETGKNIAKYISSLGFQQNYAPVCDFDINKEIIGDRSYGHNEKIVSNLAIEFIKASQENNIIATAKHFPGHGNVKGDSHKGLVTIKGEPSELKVFENVIKGGVISVMIGHIAISGSKKYNTDGKPSTISRNIVTDLLRNDLGFQGIIITDAMNMQGVSGFSKPSLEAVKAGCDMILFPSDENSLIQSVLKEIDSNEELKMQIEKSVKRIIRLKICLGMFSHKAA